MEIQAKTLAVRGQFKIDLQCFLLLLNDRPFSLCQFFEKVKVVSVGPELQTQGSVLGT
jgi:hypothetical protein